MNDQKITINVLIENDQLVEDDFVIKQKLNVIVNKVVAAFKISSDDRELRREDGSPLDDLTQAIEEAGIYDGETLRFFKKVDKPDRDQRFAMK